MLPLQQKEVKKEKPWSHKAILREVRLQAVYQYINTSAIMPHVSCTFLYNISQNQPTMTTTFFEAMDVGSGKVTLQKCFVHQQTKMSV